MRARRDLGLLAALAALALGLPACGGSDDEPTETIPAAQEDQPGEGRGRSGRRGGGGSGGGGGGGGSNPGGVPQGPEDPLRGDQYALEAIKLPEAWKRSSGRGAVIAIVDTGVDLGHPDLKSRLVAGYDFIDNDDDPKDKYGHGTHVAGIAAAATANGIGIAGGGPSAKIMPVRVLDNTGSGSTTNIQKGIEWAADHGADVINLSLGETGLASRLIKGGQLNQTVRKANQRGAVVVAAAGNQGTNKPAYRSSTPILVVSASDQNGQPARFSDFGEEQGVSAPGVNILSTLPTYPVDLSDEQSQPGYGHLDGTSMASPYVAAIAGLLAAQGRSADDIISIIRKTAKNPSQDKKLGLGIVDAQAAVGSGT